MLEQRRSIISHPNESFLFPVWPVVRWETSWCGSVSTNHCTSNFITTLSGCRSFLIFILHPQLIPSIIAVEVLVKGSCVNFSEYCGGRNHCGCCLCLQVSCFWCQFAFFIFSNSTSLIRKTQEYWEIIGCENMQQYASNYYDEPFGLDEGFL